MKKSKSFREIEKHLLIEDSTLAFNSDDGFTLPRGQGRAPLQNRSHFSFRLDRKLNSDLYKAAKRLGKTKSAIANELFRDWLSKQKQ